MNNNRQPPRDQVPALRVVESDMPHNEQAEAIVLGTLINFPKKIEEVIDSLQPGDFYTIRHRILYEVMLDYYRKHGKAADFLVLSDLLEGNEDLHPSDLVELMYLKNEIWSADLQQDVRLITGPSVQRQTIFASHKLANAGYSITDPDKLRESAETILYGLSMSRPDTSDFESIEDVLSGCMDDIEMACKNRGKMLGIPTRFTDLDLMTNGLQRTDLILLAARPGFGKTSLGLGIGYNAAKAGYAVAVFSLEMGKKQLGTRLLSLVSRIPSTRLRAGWLDDDEMKTVVESSDAISELSLHIDDTAGSPISSIRSKLRRLRAKIHRPVDLVIVDYLQLMEDEDDSSAKRENRNQEISKISRGLKALAREFNVPVLALAQLSRAVEARANKRPQLSDLRDSGSLEQDADIVMFIYREDVYNPDSDRHGMADVIIAKHRNGPVGEVTLKFNPSLTRFDNIYEDPSEEEHAG